MKLQHSDEDGSQLAETNVAELDVLRNVLALVLDEENIYAEEFETRVGWSRDEVLAVASDLAREPAPGDPVLIPIDMDVAGILAESANEVLHGFRVPDFERAVGDRLATKRLHQELKRIYYALENTSSS